jgi:hypothetical protein
VCGGEFDAHTGNAAARFTIFGATFHGAEIVETPDSANAKLHMSRSLAVAAGAPPLVLLFAHLSGVSWTVSSVAAAIAIYVAWASYWGVLGVLELLAHEASGAADVAIHFLFHHLHIHGFVLPVLIGVVYGTLGGGVWEFSKHRRTMRNPASGLESAANRNIRQQ